MNSKEFINRYRKIKLKYLCKRVKVNYSNILNGTASNLCFDKLKNELDKEILLLYKGENE